MKGQKENRINSKIMIKKWLNQLNIFSNKRYITDDDLETLKEHRDLMNYVITGDYKPDSFTNQPINNLINRLES